MAYQKTRKSPEKFFTYPEVGAIAKATQEQIEKWVPDYLVITSIFSVLASARGRDVSPAEISSSASRPPIH